MKFSILIPAYKDAFLVSCIDSVLSQSYSDFEIIIVNDASPFPIDEIMSKYSDSRIIYSKNEKGFGAKNVVDNWNRCLELSSGDYVICMGDDDRLMPNCLMDYYDSIQQHPGFNIYHIRTEVIDENGTVIDLQEDRPEYETVYSMLWHRLVKNRMQYIGDFLFKRTYIEKQGGFYKLPYACYSDDISAYIAAQEKGIYNINMLGFQYRNNSQTITNTQDLKLVASSVQQAVTWMRSFLQSVPNSEESILYRELTLRTLTDYENGMYKYCFRNSMRKDLFQGKSYWWKHRKVYSISNKYYLKVLFGSIIRRFKNK